MLKLKIKEPTRNNQRDTYSIPGHCFICKRYCGLGKICTHNHYEHIIFDKKGKEIGRSYKANELCGECNNGYKTN